MSERDLPTGIVTFLFTDIEGSTRLLQQVGADAFTDIISAHHAIFRDVAGPSVVSTEGDSFFCVFATPTEAVEAAVEIQRRLGAEQWPGGAAVHVRMGIHTGEGVLGGDDYVGLDVHKAARISSAAHGGQVLVSAASRAHLVERLAGNVELRDLGDHRLKDLASPEHLYQLLVEGLPADFPPIRTQGAGPTNLPEQLNDFIGRDAELSQAVDALGQSRLVTLTGVGGAGKTRLAIQAGRRVHDAGDRTVLFSSLADLDDPELIDSHVAGQLSIRDQIGRPSIETIAAYFGAGRYLLVVDNCEHLVDGAAAFVESLLRASPELKVLATSREALQIAGERVLPVGPMAQAGSEAEDVSDAVRLFAARVAEVMPGFDLEMWRQECAEICSRLDAIPLAIELAAARATMLTPREILERLDDRFSLLTGSSRTSSGRHATLQAAIDWSYDLLDEAGQRLLQKLAIFRGGFTIGSVRAVCFEDDVAETEVLDLLSGLRSRSLVTQAIGHRGTRFGLLESIREYAIARLRDQGRYESLEQRHREHFTALARGESLRLNRSEQLEALDVLEDDHDNLRAVLARSTDAGDFEAAADMAGSLTLFWFFHAHFTEAERWAERVLPALPVEPGKAWLRLLLGAVQYDTRTGHLSRAAERVGEALRIATERNAPRTEMWARAYLATIDLYRIDMASAQREAGIALDIADRIGDFIGLGYATFIDVGVEAWRARLNDDLSFDRANELLERLGPVVIGARAAGDRNIIGHVVQMEAQLLDATGRHETAATAFDEAIRSFADLGNVACACHCFEAIAMYAAAGEDFAAAARILGATSRLRSRVGITPAPIEIELRDHALSLSEAALSTEAAESEIITGAEMSLAELAQYTRGLLA